MAVGRQLNDLTGVIHSAALAKIRKDPRKTVMTTMKDLKADWRKWSRAERWLAASFAIATSAIVPVLFVLGEG